MNYGDELHFSSDICDLLNDKKYVAQTEINSGYGIADVVAIKFNKKRILQRLDYVQTTKLENESFFKVLEFISENDDSPSNLEDIILKTSLSKDYIRTRVIKQLLDNKFIKTVGNNQYVKINGWAPLSDEIIAIESKLCNWRRGITQAIRYKTFADIVYLALPSNKIDVVKIGDLREYNIGLLTIKNGALDIIHKPLRKNVGIVNSKQNFVCEHFWAGPISSYAFAMS